MQPFIYPNLTDRGAAGRTLAPGSDATWRVGGALLTETRTFSDAPYASLPYSRLTLTNHYTLPVYTQDVWSRTRNTTASVSFVVFLQNNAAFNINITPGDGWSGAVFTVSAQTAALLLVLDDGTGATPVPIGSAAALAGSFTVTTMGPLTATSPVVLGGNLALNNTALDSIATNSWKAGTFSLVGPNTNNIAIGHQATATGPDSTAVGYQAGAATSSVTMGSQASSTASDQVVIGRLGLGQNVGAVAVGSNSSATGTNSIAVGYHALTTNLDGTGVGYNVQVLADHATGVGANAFANTLGTSVGDSSTAGINGSSLGANTTSRTNSVAVGYLASNSDVQSVAVGRSASSANSAVAVGYLASASGTDSIAIGHSASATQTESTAIGHGVSNTTANTTLIGDGTTPTSHEVISTGFLRAIVPAAYRASFDLQLCATTSTTTTYVTLNTPDFAYGGIDNFSSVTIQLPRKTDSSANIFLVCVEIFAPLTSGDIPATVEVIDMQQSYIIDGVVTITNEQLTSNQTGLDATTCMPATSVRAFQLTNSGTVHLLRFRAMKTVDTIHDIYCRGVISIYRLN